MAADEKTCPYCAETIKAAAVVCKHCGRDLPAPAPASMPADQATSLKVEAERLGIIWSPTAERFVWRRTFFETLDDALAAARPGVSSPPKPAEQPQLLTDAAQASPAQRDRMHWSVWLLIPLGLVGVLMAIGMSASRDPEYQAMARAREIYELCVSDMKDELRSAGFREASRQMCERLREDFRRKYGREP